MGDGTSKTKPDRRAVYNQRMREAGFRLVAVWVPDGQQSEIKAVAERLRSAVVRQARAKRAAWRL